MIQPNIKGLVLETLQANVQLLSPALVTKKADEAKQSKCQMR